MILGLAFLVFESLFHWVWPDRASTDANLQIAAVVAPIVAIATIVVFVLIGAFRGFRDRDAGNLPVVALLRDLTNRMSQ